MTLLWLDSWIIFMIYWDMGNAILQKQQLSGWGAKVIDRLSSDHCDSFSAMSGFSARNLKYIRKFAENLPDREIVQRTAAQIPWRSNLTFLEKLEEPGIRYWYAAQTIKNL